MPGLDYPQLFERFSQLKVMVVGDVMLDAYIFGKVERISPEAPVPVVLVEKCLSRLGGAANVAVNLKSMGAEPILCSVTGDDQRGKEFMELLEGEGISGQAIISSKDRITTTKFRIIGNKTQMLRVDEEHAHDLSTSDQTRLLDKIYDIIESSKVDAIIIQDYNKGVLTAELITGIIEKARSHNIPVAVDPKKKNFLLYKECSLFKPNLKELREGLGIEIKSGDPGSLKEAAEILHKKLDINTVMVTLSDEGVFASRVGPDSMITQHLVPAHKRNISDVSGAGDTVISIAALCMACRVGLYEMASLSNLAGGLVCEEVGVVPVNRDKLLREACILK